MPAGSSPRWLRFGPETFRVDLLSESADGADVKVAQFFVAWLFIVAILLGFTSGKRTIGWVVFVLILSAVLAAMSTGLTHRLFGDSSDLQVFALLFVG